MRNYESTQSIQEAVSKEIEKYMKDLYFKCIDKVVENGLIESKDTTDTDEDIVTKLRKQIRELEDKLKIKEEVIKSQSKLIKEKDQGMNGVSQECSYEDDFEDLDY